MTAATDQGIERGLEVASTELFVGTTDEPRQVVRVSIAGLQGSARVVVTGPGVSGELVTTSAVAEVGVQLEPGADVGDTVALSVEVVDDAGTLSGTGELRVSEPGWTMHLISHFHYDPVWWNTQAAYAVTWNEADELAAEFRMGWQQPGFALIDTHVDLARRDPDYKFVLAEVDLLKPYWDARPEQRDYLRRLVAEGRLELLGGTYNEPNTNLTSAEVTIRNFVYGAGFQRELFGADPATAWQLDAFGHDPQFPGLAADAGVSSSSWARGPFRPWGPMLTAFLPGAEGWGDPRTMQFPSEFEWIAPSGRGLLTHYMPAHYSAGWVLDEAATRDDAEAALFELFVALKDVAATRNVLLPVGTDYTPPNKWLTDIHRHWNDTYVWPRFVCAIPREFFAAVRAELDADGRTLSPQTRDMNPIFTGKDVSFIDTKQAHRAAETALVDAEKFAVFARAVGAPYPEVAFDKAWRHLLYCAHHDAVTGSESDQVYLDLLTNWREALDLAQETLTGAVDAICQRIDVDGGGRVLTVFNPSSWTRTDLTTVRVELPSGELTGLAVADVDGAGVEALVEVFERHPDCTLACADVTFLAAAVPGLGYRTWRLTESGHVGERGWSPTPSEGTATIESAAYRLVVDPARGGCVTSLFDKRAGRELMVDGAAGNALLCSEEYAEHPTFNEGPWHLLPNGTTVSSADSHAESVVVSTSPIGSRITVRGRLDGVTYVQTVTLWTGIDRVDCRTELHGFAGADRLFRVKWPAGIDGAMPVSEVGNAVVGRGHAIVDADTADHPWTLDNPAYGFFALSSTAKVSVQDPDGARFTRAIGTAEIVTAGEPVRQLAVALVRCGVTATSSVATGPRYGSLAIDSNLPDVRISVGTPEDNSFTAEILAASPEHAQEWSRQWATTGTARVWVPGTVPLAQVWQPSADLRDGRALPVLLVAGPDAAGALADDLDDAVIEVPQSAPAASGPDLDDFTVGLINRGTPGFAVDTAGALHMSLMRACTGWPSGVWIDPPRRTMPDGSNFQQQHWSHTFDYAVASGAGDWRATDLVTAAHDVNHPLVTRAHVPTGDLLPGQMSFLSVESDDTVVVTAVKAAGNPMAQGQQPGVHDDVTVRLYEASGRPAVVRLTAHGGWTDTKRLDHLEQAGEPLAADANADADELAIEPGEVVTLGGRLHPITGAKSLNGYGFREPVQPVYTRYWLNNTGTAPAGNVPVAVHFSTDHVRANGDFAISVTVASTLVDATAEGTVRLRPPPGWTASPCSRDVALGPGAHCFLDAEITVPVGTAPGVYPLAAEIEYDGQTFHDLCRVYVGDAGPEKVTAELAVSEVRLAVGETGAIGVRVGSDAAGVLPAQVQLITPWDIWPLLPTWNSGAEIPAGGEAVVDFPVVVPPGTRPGTWWAIAKVAVAGRVQFTEAIDLVVTE